MKLYPLEALTTTMGIKFCKSFPYYLILLFTMPWTVYGAKKTESHSFYERMIHSPKREALKHLCGKSKLSHSCGDHVCQKHENHLNCPSDCDEKGNDFIFETHKSATYNARTWCPKIQELVDPENINDVQDAILRARKAGIE